MIVGTAGHIDHGKTTLVKALTGVDADRLPEEKRRGISIELGYAFLDLPGLPDRIGFIDVPGHEKLVHTMISGATGMDAALLLVAADDGVMPQTREHLAVLSLLGVRSGAAIVTKTDRADADRVRAVQAETQALLAQSTLAGAPVWPVSATTGAGLQPLRDWLAATARQSTAPQDEALGFRLAVDRAFVLPGVGTVVTGTVHAGQVQVGDEVRLIPGNRTARVRSVHAQNLAVPGATAGQRCALALAGIERDHIERGQWLVTPAFALSTQRLDTMLTLWTGEGKPLRSGTPVHVHIGAAATLGTVAVLDKSALSPGETGRVQLVLREAVGAWHGERVVLRDASATRTLAGGQVLDPQGPTRYRRTPQRLAELGALALPTPAERIAALLVVAPAGVDLRLLATAQGRALDTSSLAPGVLRQRDAQADWALGAEQAAQARQRVLQVLAAFHARQPDELGPDAARLRRLALPRLPGPLWQALLSDLVGGGLVREQGAFVHLPAHGALLSETERRLAQKVAPLLAAAGREGAWVRDLAHDAREPEPLMRVTLARLARRGELHQVVRDLYLAPTTLHALGRIARAVAAAHGGEVTAGQYRDATQLGRRRAVQVLEYLDRIGLLRRVGDGHRLRPDCHLFQEPGA